MMRKVARNALAAMLMVIGIAGLFLPVIQGIATILLAVVVADFEAKERLLERYRHTRIGRRLWDHHEASKAREAARKNCVSAATRTPVPQPLTIESTANDK